MAVRPVGAATTSTQQGPSGAKSASRSLRAHTLNAVGQSRVTLSLRQENLRAACGPRREEKGAEIPKTTHSRRPSPVAVRLGGSALPIEWVVMRRWAELRRFAAQEKLPWPLEDSAAACFERWARAFNATSQRYSLPVAFRENCESPLQCASPLRWARDQIFFDCPGGDGYAERQMPVAVNVSSFYAGNAPT